MVYYIKDLREQNAILSFSLLHKKIFSAYSHKALNEPNTYFSKWWQDTKIKDPFFLS